MSVKLSIVYRQEPDLVAAGVVNRFHLVNYFGSSLGLLSTPIRRGPLTGFRPH
jgi:hypothetical protein